MEIASFGLTDTGREREHNEDFLLVEPDLGLFAVCDGMGGQNAGEVASRLAATTIRRVVAQKKDLLVPAGNGTVAPEKLAGLLRTAIDAACNAVHEEASRDKAKHGMGCTRTALLVAGGKAVLGQVGDSRLYLCRGGTCTQLSEDHTVVAEMLKQGVLSPEDVASFAYRNVITRANGKDFTVLVDTLVFDLVLGDTLLLCSDGLYGYFPDPGELAALLAAPDPENIPARLVRLANDRSGGDNITAIVIRAKETALNAGDTQRSNDVLSGLDALRRIEIMRDLTMAEVVKLNQVFEEVRFPQGGVVMNEGEVSDTLFVLVEGSAEVLRGGKRIAVLPAGAHFGDMSLLSCRPRSATVRALEPSRMLVVDRTRLYGFLQQDAMLAAKFFWKIAETLARRLEDQIANERAPLPVGAAPGR
jgi:serine/threonine protein phosphatase PrpC